MAHALHCRPRDRRIPVGGAWWRMGAHLDSGIVRSGDLLRACGQTRLDVRGRPVHRLRHSPRGWMHQRPRHLWPVELRASQSGDDDEFHGGRDCDHAIHLSRAVSSLMALLYLALGTLFGFVLSRSGAADYNYIQAMFLFTSFQLYGIIGTAVVLTAPGLWLLKRYGRTVSGLPIVVPLKPLHRGSVVGGIFF